MKSREREGLNVTDILISLDLTSNRDARQKCRVRSHFKNAYIKFTSAGTYIEKGKGTGRTVGRVCAPNAKSDAVTYKLAVVLAFSRSPRMLRTRSRTAHNAARAYTRRIKNRIS